MKFLSTPMSQNVFEFKDLFLEVKNEDKNISTEYAKLLDGVSGKFVSGELTAVMGASGAGKSTLFNMLLGRISNDCKSYGTILYNGKERSAYDWVHQVAYLKQEDIFYTKFSILECILYNLDFYQPFTSKKEKLSLAEDLLRRSNIFEKRHAYLESLSGGERKRAMIALSMCSDPEIIFMDEPTSGLDSHSALTLINFMKTYAKENNKIVVISLHQPGEALFNLFENILYLGKGGVFYDGKIKDIPDWLNENKMPKPEGISLAEFLFELHTDNPHPPEIGRFRSNVDQIINSNRQKYDELRRSNVLVGKLSSRYFEMSLSLVDVITFIRRFYLDLYRTEGFFFKMTIHTLVLMSLIGLFYIVSRVIITQTLLSVSPYSNTMKEAIDYVKSYATSDMKRFLSHFLFGNFLFCVISYIFYIQNSCNNRIQILEDIYSAKYTVLTCFLGYVLHDFFVTTFWFTCAYGLVLFSGLLPLINYWYLIYIFSAICCFTINYIFMKCLFGFSNRSKILTSIVYSVGLFASIPLLLGYLIGSFQKLFPGHENKTKYVGCLFTIFPQILLVALFNYKNIESIQAHTGDLKGNQLYVPFEIYKFNIKDEPSSQFGFVGLDDAPYSVIVSIFVVSILINFFGALFLFNRHVNAELRLKMS